MEEAEALADVDFDLELAHGDPARALVDAAREHDADEIVVGTRGGGRVGSLLGSVAHDVLHHADRPVVVIPDRAVRDHPTEGP
jgi:nucleotide-binding universal stress UspA family protein